MSRADKLPEDSRLNAYYVSGDYLDSFSSSLKGRQDLLSADIRLVADHVLDADIGWMNRLLSARDRIVKPLGLKTTDELLRKQSGLPVSERRVGDRIGFFRIYGVEKDEIILGEDDWHQDFRLSIFRSHGDDPRVYASTVCKRHNLFGYAYLALILPFHKKIAATVLDAAVERKLAA